MLHPSSQKRGRDDDPRTVDGKLGDHDVGCCAANVLCDPCGHRPRPVILYSPKEDAALCLTDR